MKMDFQNQEQVQYMNNEQRRVRGSTVFLAELFVQLNRPEVSAKLHESFWISVNLFGFKDTRRAVAVSHYVLDSIMLLLTKPGPENIKCVCQTLKVGIT